MAKLTFRQLLTGYSEFRDEYTGRQIFVELGLSGVAMAYSIVTPVLLSQSGARTLEAAHSEFLPVGIAMFISFVICLYLCFFKEARKETFRHKRAIIAEILDIFMAHPK